MNNMLSLSDHHKREFVKRIEKISSKDEEKVRKNILKEIEKLKSLNESKSMIKLDDLIRDASLLYTILHCESFPMTENSKKWIVFGLGYLVSDFDLIPDSIPNIGYVDDAIVVSWVLFMIKDVIERFKVHQEYVEFSKNGGVLKPFISNENTIIIVIQGIVFQSTDIEPDPIDHTFVNCLNFIYEKPSISTIEYKMSHLPEMMNVLRIVDHDLALKPVYDRDVLQVEYQQAIIDYKNLGKALSIDIESIKKENPQKNIILLAFDFGSFLIEKCIEEISDGCMNECYIFGGLTRSDSILKLDTEKLGYLHNYYSEKDSMLKFLYDNFEYSHTLTGLVPVVMNHSAKIVNHDVSQIILNHHEYKTKLGLLLNCNYHS